MRNSISCSCREPKEVREFRARRRWQAFYRLWRIAQRDVKCYSGSMDNMETFAQADYPWQWTNLVDPWNLDALGHYANYPPEERWMHRLYTCRAILLRKYRKQMDRETILRYMAAFPKPIRSPETWENLRQL
jgi:hypothetical protein